MWLVEALKYAALGVVWMLILGGALIVAWICLLELFWHAHDWYTNKIEENSNEHR